jgi:ribosomal protein S18 acetylase RimI-like enzyme
MIRDARLADLNALVALEERCFELDRFSRRQFRYLITRAQGRLLVDERRGKLIGYVLVLFRRGTSLARLYSIAVDSRARGKGAGRDLLQAAEKVSVDASCAYLRLEVRPDNAEAIRLYRSAGYRKLGEVSDYYEDGMEALRYEKALAPRLKPSLVRVPYYEQTLDFTCGSSALMMAMKALDPALRFSRTLELRLWREATTIFMTSGHGGCGPLGLALAAADRGFGAEVMVNDKGVPFLDSVRSKEKKEVMRLVHEDMLDRVKKNSIPVRYGNASLQKIESRFKSGAVPIVLISLYHFYEQKVPHWVVITGFEDRFVYVNDPFVDRKREHTRTDCINMPVAKLDFERMSRYGRAGLQAAVFVSKNASSKHRGPQGG